LAKNEVTLLQEIVGQLRTLNKSSVRDRLREAEEAKRAEKLAMVQEGAAEEGQLAVDAQTDFQRRYLAGQAGAFTDAALRDAPRGIIQKVIAKATDSTHKWTAQNYRILKIQRLQSAEFYRWNKKKSKDDQRDDDELARENMYMFQKMLMPFEKIAADWAIKREKWLESKEIYKEYWQRFKWGIIITTLTAAYLAYEGLHSVSILIAAKLKDMVKVSKAWKTSIGGISALYVSLRTNILKWFGYDKTGKALSLKSQGGFKWTNPLNFGAMQAGMMARLSALRTNILTQFGLKADGSLKPLKGTEIKTFSREHGWKIKSVPNAPGVKAGAFTKATTRIGKIMSPVLRLSTAIGKFFTTQAGRAIEKGLNAVKKLGSITAAAGGGWLKMLGKILWPVTILFSIFAGFSKAKDEYMKEDSNWFTILGAATGGVLGYLFGALADLLKSGIVWVIKSIFKLKTDENGKVLPGQGAMGAVAEFLQGFSFEDLINTLVSGIFNMVNNVVGFVVGMFTSADYRAGVWDWITELPGRIGKWIKGFVPEWIQKVLGIYEGSADWSTSAQKGSALWVDSMKEWFMKENPKNIGMWIKYKPQQKEKKWKEFIDDEKLQMQFHRANMWDQYRTRMGIKEGEEGKTFWNEAAREPTTINQNTILQYMQTAGYMDELIAAGIEQGVGYR
jgi:hypothetical protein